MASSESGNTFSSAPCPPVFPGEAMAASVNILKDKKAMSESSDFINPPGLILKGDGVK